MDLSKLVTFPNPLYDGIDWQLKDIQGLEDCEMMLWGGYCGVHTVFTTDQVHRWHDRGWRVLVHPETPFEVVEVADGSGSTAYLWHEVLNSPAGSQYAIGTEGHFVQNLKEQAACKGIEVMHLADIPTKSTDQIKGGCGCATMSRNDPPHLAGMLDLLRKGEPPDLNRVLAGDTVDEQSAKRERLSDSDRKIMMKHAKSALVRMIEITERSA
jgi:quinolinate synthase